MKPNKDETKRMLSQLIIYYKKVKRENENLKSQNKVLSKIISLQNIKISQLKKGQSKYQNEKMKLKMKFFFLILKLIKFKETSYCSSLLINNLHNDLDGFSNIQSSLVFRIENAIILINKKIFKSNVQLFWNNFKTFFKRTKQTNINQNKNLEILDKKNNNISKIIKNNLILNTKKYGNIKDFNVEYETKKNKDLVLQKNEKEKINNDLEKKELINLDFENNRKLKPNIRKENSIINIGRQRNSKNVEENKSSINVEEGENSTQIGKNESSIFSIEKINEDTIINIKEKVNAIYLKKKENSIIVKEKKKNVIDESKKNDNSFINTEKKENLNNQNFEIKSNKNNKQNFEETFLVILKCSNKKYKMINSALKFFREYTNHYNINSFNNNLNNKIDDISKAVYSEDSLLNKMKELIYNNDKKGENKYFNFNKKGIFQDICKNNKILLDNEDSNNVFSEEKNCSKEDIYMSQFNNIKKDEIELLNEKISHYKKELNKEKKKNKFYDEIDNIKTILDNFREKYNNLINEIKKEKSFIDKKNNIKDYEYKKIYEMIKKKNNNSNNHNNTSNNNNLNNHNNNFNKKSLLYQIHCKDLIKENLLKYLYPANEFRIFYQSSGIISNHRKSLLKNNFEIQINNIKNNLHNDYLFIIYYSEKEISKSYNFYLNINKYLSNIILDNKNILFKIPIGHSLLKINEIKDSNNVAIAILQDNLNDELLNIIQSHFNKKKLYFFFEYFNRNHLKFLETLFLNNFNELNINIQKRNNCDVLNFQNFSNLKTFSFKTPNNTKLIFSNELINNLEVLKVLNVLIEIKNNSSKDIIKNLNYLELNNSYFANENKELNFISNKLIVFIFESNTFSLSTFPSFYYLNELKKFKFYVLNIQDSINEIKDLKIELECLESNNCIKQFNEFLNNELKGNNLNFEFIIS